MQEAWKMICIEWPDLKQISLRHGRLNFACNFPRVHGRPFSAAFLFLWRLALFSFIEPTCAIGTVGSHASLSVCLSVVCCLDWTKYGENNSLKIIHISESILVRRLKLKHNIGLLHGYYRDIGYMWLLNYWCSGMIALTELELPRFLFS